MRCLAKLRGKQKRRCIRQATDAEGYCAQHRSLMRDMQAERLRHKEEAKGREVVDCVMRILVPSPSSARRGDEELAVVIEAAVQMTREELDTVQKAHAKDNMIINYIMEDKA